MYFQFGGINLSIGSKEVSIFAYAYCLGGGLKHCLFSPLLVEMIQFDEHIFQLG